MSTLTAQLTLSSTNSTSNKLNLTVSDTLTTSIPHQGLTRVAITTADDQQILSTASGIYYVYIKNLDATNFVILQTVASVQWGRISAGEFAFFAVNDSAGLELRADTASCNVEYAYWKKG
jgi:hypothetical protein